MVSRWTESGDDESSQVTIGTLEVENVAWLEISMPSILLLLSTLNMLQCCTYGGADPLSGRDSRWL